MKDILVPDVERLKDQTYLFRTLTTIIAGLNAFIGNVQAGEVTLVAGTATVSFSGLTPTSRIIAGYARIAGTPGTLSIDPQKYDLAKRIFTISSSSGSDNSAVTWQLMN